MENINPEIIHYIDHCRARMKLQPNNMRVLDYGCGSGKSVLSLRLSGYQAFGVDIDKRTVLEGQKLLDQHGFDGKNILRSFDENNSIPFDDNYFHFVMSQEVIEHVNDLSIMAHDLRRVSTPGGFGFHAFRPQYNIIEPHFYMPFVHWLPKNKLRKYAIALFAYLGIGMHPPEIPSAGPRERANFLYCYSINQTFYRPYPIIGNAFRENGFGICFPITNHRKIRKSRLLSRLLKLPMLNNLLTWFIMTFRNAYLLTLSQNEDGTIHKYSQLENWKSELFVDIAA